MDPGRRRAPSMVQDDVSTTGDPDVQLQASASSGRNWANFSILNSTVRKLKKGKQD